MRTTLHTYTPEQIEDARLIVSKGKGERWRARLAYYDQSGKRREIGCSLPGDVKSKASAKRAAASWHRTLIDEARKERDRLAEDREAAEHPRWTVPEYAAYVIDKSPANSSTKLKYRSYLRRIQDRFSGVKLDELTADMVADWQEAMEREGLAPASIIHAHAMLNQVMRYAVEEDELIDSNPCRKRIARPPRRPHSEPNALGATERGRLLDYLQTASYRPIVMAARIALLTGMRLGEICGLRWKDIDMERGMIHVRNAIGIEDGGTYQKEPKTGASIRDLPMPSQLLQALKERRADMWAQRIAAAPTTAEQFGELFVIGDIDGSYRHPNPISKEWATLAGFLELKGTQSRRPTFHDLRHTFITAALTDANADVKTVASMAGHSKVSHTLDIYASADPEARARLAARIDEIMAEERERARIQREKEAAEMGQVVWINGA